MKNNLKTQNLTEGIIWQRLLIFTFPIFMGTLFQSLYTTADAIIVGQFTGKHGLAALEAVYFLTKLPVNFFTGLASGATIIISQYYGAHKFEKISDASHTAIVFSFIGGIILSIITCLLTPFIIQLVEVPTEIIASAKTYMIIYFVGLSALMLYNVGAGILRALGDSKTPFYFLIVASILNIVLDLIFVGLFNWGVAGAAFATLISQIASAILVMITLVKTSLPCKIYLSKLKITSKYLIRIIKIGLPIGIQGILYPLANIIIQASINTFGVNCIAAWAVCGKLDFLIWAISDAFYIAVSTFVAQNIGASQPIRAKKGVKITLLISIFIVLGISTILYFWHIPLGYLLIDDAEVIGITSQIIHLFAPLYFVYIFAGILPGAIQGTGETVKPMILTLLGTGIFRIAWIAFILPHYPSFMTVMLCFPLSWAITALLFIGYYWYHFYVKMAQK